MGSGRSRRSGRFWRSVKSGRAGDLRVLGGLEGPEIQEGQRGIVECSPLGPRNLEMLLIQKLHNPFFQKALNYYEHPQIFTFLWPFNNL